MPPVEDEQDVPEHAQAGGRILAYGLHAGVRKLFQARVLRIRRAWPPIVVRYEALADGTIPGSSLSLPELSTAYLAAGDTRPLA